MAKIRKKYIFAGILSVFLLVILSMALGLYFYTSKFVSIPDDYLRKQLRIPSSVQYDLEDLSGSFHSGFKITGLVMKYNDNIFFSVDTAFVECNVFPLIFKSLFINRFEFVNPLIDLSYFPPLSEIRSREKTTSGSGFRVDVKDLIVSKLAVKREAISLILDMRMDLSVRQGLIQAGISRLNINNPALLAEITGTELEYSGQILRIDNNRFTVEGDDTVTGDMDILLQMNEGGFPIDFIVSGYTVYRDDPITDIMVSGIILQDGIRVQRSVAKYGDGIIEMTGNMDFARQNWVLNGTIRDFAGEFKDNPFLLNGRFSLSGLKLKADHGVVESAEIRINDMTISDVQGEFLIQKNQIVNEGRISFRFDNVSGLLDTFMVKYKDSLRISGQIVALDMNPSKYLPSLPHINITGAGDVALTSFNGNLDIQSRLALKSTTYGSLNLGDSRWAIRSSWTDGVPGDMMVAGSADGFSLKNIQLKETYMKALYSDGYIYLDYFYGFNDDGDYIFFSAHTDTTFSNAELDSLSGKIKGIQYFAPKATLAQSDDLYQFVCEDIFLSEGVIDITGEYRGSDEYLISSTVENINVDDLLTVIGKEYPISGILNGNFQLSKWNDKPVFVSEMNLEKGYIEDLNFDLLTGKISYRDGRLLLAGVNSRSHFGDVSVSGWMNLSGDPQGMKIMPEDSLEIQAVFTEFNLDAIEKYIPWKFATRGKVDGDISLSGSFSDVNMDAQISIDNPQFDKLTGSKATGHIVYEDKKLYFKEGTVLTTESGEYTITGILPVDIDFYTVNRKEFFNESMDLLISGNTGELEFFYPYFDVVDSLLCDCTIQLSLKGPWTQPVRSGQVLIRNGKVNVLQLNNSFDNLNGYISVEDNLLTIHSLSGFSIEPEGNQDLLNTPIEYIQTFLGNEPKPITSSNVVAGGVIDLTSFFKPDFNVWLKGERMYLEDSQNSFSGTGQADFSVTGMDTLFITGEFIPDPYNFTLTSEFTEEAVPDVDEPSGAITMIYDIHISMDNVLLIENSYMELEVEGDLTINAMGDEDFRFTGNMYVIGGTFYLNGNEFTDTEGQVVFDPYSPYPTLNVSAFTEINGEIFKIIFSGPLDNPTVYFESENAGYDYSQDEILRILLARDKSMLTEGNFNLGTAGRNILSNYLENVLERYIARNSPIDKFQLQSQGSLLSDLNNADLNLYIGKRLSRKLYMNIRSDIFSDQITSEYEVIYRLDKNQSIVIRLGEDGLPHLNYQIKYIY